MPACNFNENNTPSQVFFTCCKEADSVKSQNAPHIKQKLASVEEISPWR